MVSVSDKVSGSGWNIISLCIIFSISMLMFITAPTDGSYWDSESARNPLNGVFIRDLLVELPWGQPIEWAKNYYYQYPALTIMFYPPAFYGVEGLWFLAFGASHVSAVALVCTYFFFFLLGIYRIGCLCISKQLLPALIICMSFAPSIALGARHVMLEIPAYTFFVWSLYCAIRYRDGASNVYLYGSLLLALLAVYTKQTSVILALILPLIILPGNFTSVIRNKHTYLSLFLGLVCSIPLILMQIKFGSFNLKSLSTRDDILIEKYSFEGIFYYFTIADKELGYVLSAFMIVVFFAVVMALVLNKSGSSIFRHLNRLWVNASSRSMLSWLLVSFLFFIFVALKTPRHGILFYVPLIFFSFVLFDKVSSGRIASFLAAVLSVFVAVESLYYHPVPTVNGYKSAADYVYEKLDENARVGFLGNGDGSFITNFRMIDAQRRFTVTRIDKLLLDVNIMPQLGLGAKDIGVEEMQVMIRNYGLQYIVVEEGKWASEPVVRRFTSILESSHFSKDIIIPVEGEVPAKQNLIIYRNNHKFLNPPKNYPIKTSSGMEITYTDLNE